ncbi:unnamed protein product [Eruca vesicaria subsp. sativa]|uniref:Uncharacterized protein n=1 Tax=Eruca vesicaria subsp. sativa TaxID=29727 RepID=A0ABC8KK87_ERUVS|nr:unnamed protein product [Eruca vesicaria subsp. sativa]
MSKKKELLSKALWRGDDDDSDKFSGAKLKVTKDADGMSKMHVRGRGTNKGSLANDEDSLEIDPQLRYSFNRNYQVSTTYCEVKVPYEEEEDDGGDDDKEKHRRLTELIEA